MKKLLTIIALLISLQIHAREAPDRFTCFADHKVETPPTGKHIEYPWKETELSVVFDYDKKQIIIYAKQTLTLNIKDVGPHYDNEEGKNSVDMQAIDQEGKRAKCTLVIGEDKREETLIVRYRNAYLVYRLKKIN